MGNIDENKGLWGLGRGGGKDDKESGVKDDD